MTSSNENIFRVTGHLCGEFTAGHRWIPRPKLVTRSFDVFFDLRLYKRWVNNREAGDLRHHRANSLWRHCNDRTNRLIVRSYKDSNTWDWVLTYSHRLAIWQALRQHRCRDTGQISKPLKHSDLQSHSFETWRDLMILKRSLWLFLLKSYHAFSSFQTPTLVRGRRDILLCTANDYRQYEEWCTPVVCGGGFMRCVPRSRAFRVQHFLSKSTPCQSIARGQSLLSLATTHRREDWYSCLLGILRQPYSGGG